MAIETSQEIMFVGKTPPWDLLAAFMQSLGSVDLSMWGSYDFSEEQLGIVNKYLPTLNNVIDFYNT